LNYGRILNNVRFQDAQFRELVVAYQDSVLQADLEVENGIVTFIQSHQRSQDLGASVNQSWVALQVLIAQYQAGLSGIDFNRYATIEQTLVTQQDQWAQARGQICLGLIQVYRGLGGGWQIKCSPPPVSVEMAPTPPTTPEITNPPAITNPPQIPVAPEIPSPPPAIPPTPTMLPSVEAPGQPAPLNVPLNIPNKDKTLAPGPELLPMPQPATPPQQPPATP
jgi:hypothetical protein